MHEQDRMHRRRFAGHVVAATGGLAVGLAAAAGRSAEIPPAPKLPEDPVPPAKPPGEPPLELLLLTYLVRNYPSDRFDDAAMQGIYREIRGDVARGQVLATFPLRNSDEPAFVFSAFRGDAPTDAPPGPAVLTQVSTKWHPSLFVSLSASCIHARRCACSVCFPPRPGRAAACGGHDVAAADRIFSGTPGETGAGL